MTTVRFTYFSFIFTIRPLLFSRPPGQKLLKRFSVIFRPPYTLVVGWAPYHHSVVVKCSNTHRPNKILWVQITVELPGYTVEQRCLIRLLWSRFHLEYTKRLVNTYLKQLYNLSFLFFL